MPSDKDPPEWTVDEVGAWLAEIGLGHLAEKFQDEAVDGEVLVGLTADDLKDLGLKLGDRKKVITRIDRMLSRGKPPEMERAFSPRVSFDLSGPSNETDENVSVKRTPSDPEAATGIRVKNTFIEVAEAENDSLGMKYKPYQSDPTGRSLFTGGSFTNDAEKHPPVLESTQEAEHDETDEHNAANVQYVSSSFQPVDAKWKAAGAGSTEAVASVSSKSATRRQPGPAQPPKMSIKNTFLHVEDGSPTNYATAESFEMSSKPYVPSMSDPFGRFSTRRHNSDQYEEEEGEEEDPGHGARRAHDGGCGGWSNPAASVIPPLWAAAAGGAVPLQPFSWAPQAGVGPPVGIFHTFHQETRGFGTLTPDARTFTKGSMFEGRLSVVTESEVHAGGTHRFLLRFASGELTKPDGVGFVFSDRLPCPKNIQKITSIFANQQGQICMRIFGGVLKGSGSCKLRPFGHGEWIEVAVDLDNLTASFHIWPCGPLNLPFLQGSPECSAYFQFGRKLYNRSCKVGQALPQLNVGHFACVVQNPGVTVMLGS